MTIKQKSLSFFLLLVLFMFGVMAGGYISIYLSQATMYSSHYKDAVDFYLIKEKIENQNIEEAKEMTTSALMKNLDALLFINKNQEASPSNYDAELNVILGKLKKQY